MLTFDFVADQS